MGDDRAGARGLPRQGRLLSFHVELRQFPHVARAFNLTREELESRILAPWLAGKAVQFEERKWPPDRARLTIYEGPSLQPSEIGLGRGWANAARHGREVTAQLLEPADAPASELASFKRGLLDRAGSAPLPLSEALAAASELYPGRRVSERLALAERAIWELLHEGALALCSDADPVTREHWQAVLLSSDSWTGARPVRVTLP